ncbi:MAG: hypothetical protein EA366_00785 [Spirulina sp. DLM2.Bin59]|nr:MAG: hypothetical protein EA366_00785 [Spirulina sp. DLM2.Bin59]
MNLDLVHARHLVELGYLQEILSVMGYPAHLIERSPEVPYHTVLAQLDRDQQDRARELACTFYPLTAEDTENIMLLQYFLELPFEIQPQAYQEVCKLFVAVNNKSVLGHFGITADQPKIHHRYIQTLPASSLLPEEAVSEVIMLFNYTSLMLGDIIEEVGTQQKSLDEALQVISERLSG